MITCHQIEPAPSEEASVQNIDDTITLDETDRHRRRIALRSDNGVEFLLELDQARLLKQGDVLRLSDGRGIKVLAEPEPLYEIRARDPMHLLQLAWHVGNRHLATQVMADHLRIREDPVIRNMLIELGASITPVSCGFDPEGGAYDEQKGAHTHHHDHQ
ncbi:MAG: urease accessory protein UreE [Granulosicoccus sp.]|nr:urease accessory protein UreE [Granulosicoccus sp.]